MRETRSSLGVGLLALIPVACCIGLPLIVAGGIGIGLAAWAGGLALTALAIVAAAALVVRVRRHRNDRAPSSTLRVRS
jgi:hypothetical protein